LEVGKWHDSGETHTPWRAKQEKAETEQPKSFFSQFWHFHYFLSRLINFLGESGERRNLIGPIRGLQNIFGGADSGIVWKQGPKRTKNTESTPVSWAWNMGYEADVTDFLRSDVYGCVMCIAAVPMQRRRMYKVHTRTIKLFRLPLLMHCIAIAIAIEGISDPIPFPRWRSFGLFSVLTNALALFGCEIRPSQEHKEHTGSTGVVFLQSRLKYSETYQSFSALVLPSQSRPAASIRIHQSTSRKRTISVRMQWRVEGTRHLSLISRTGG
jgi:hypothetical protein